MYAEVVIQRRVTCVFASRASVFLSLPPSERTPAQVGRKNIEVGARRELLCANSGMPVVFFSAKEREKKKSPSHGHLRKRAGEMEEEIERKAALERERDGLEEIRGVEKRVALFCVRVRGGGGGKVLEDEGESERL